MVGSSWGKYISRTYLRSCVVNEMVFLKYGPAATPFRIQTWSFPNPLVEFSSGVIICSRKESWFADSQLRMFPKSGDFSPTFSLWFGGKNHHRKWRPNAPKLQRGFFVNPNGITQGLGWIDIPSVKMRIELKSLPEIPDSNLTCVVCIASWNLLNKMTGIRYSVDGEH